jgi:hypothetical protein
MPIASLIAHWPLTDDARDASGKFPGDATNVTFTREGAIFNGRDSGIRVADAPPLRMNKDFTLTARVRCRVPMRGVYGDVLSKFDADQRCGVNLWIAGSSPGYTGMSDARHVHFGIDDGYLGPWEDLGRPWESNPLVPCLISYRGELYASVSDAERPLDACKVFRWAGGQRWEDCGRLGNDPDHLSVFSMIVHEGHLYGGTGIWDWGRADEASKSRPQRAITRVFRYEGGTQWRDLGQVGTGARVLSMASFEGELYASLDRGGKGECYKLTGDRWVNVGALSERDNFECLMPLGGVLYGASHHAVYRYDGGTTWANIGQNPHGITQIHAMHAQEGKLVIGTWPQGYVLRYEGGREWTNMGRIGLPERVAGTNRKPGEPWAEINEINALVTHNGKLYAGVLPKAQVYRYESDGHWTLLASLSSRPDYDTDVCPSWARVVSLTSHKGRLFAATGTSQARTIDLDPERTAGRVLGAQAGQVVDHEHDIGGDWTHLAAVREGSRLRLYINGRLTAESHAPRGHAFDLANAQPLRIGAGPLGSFDGTVTDVRLYAGALDAAALQRVSDDHALQSRP